MSRLIFGLLVSGPLVSCKSDAKINGKVKEGSVPAYTNHLPEEKPTSPPSGSGPASANSENGSTSVLNSESVSVPGAITGAFLVCAVNENNVKVEVKVGCGFQDANSKRVNIRTVAATDRFYIDSSQAAGITVTTLPGDTVYDAYFSFTGANFDSLKAAAFSAVYQVELTGLSNGEKEKTIGGTGTTIAIPPGPRWVREKLSDSNGNGLCDAGETCMFTGNGLVWFKDLGAPKDQPNASGFCDSFTDHFDDWRLPTENEIKMAFEKKIVEIAAPEYLNMVDESYWSSTTSAAGIAAVNPRSGVSASLPAAEAHRSVCVRTIPEP